MKNHIIITSVLFVIVALVHAIRAWYGTPLSLGDTYISIGFSWGAAVILLFLAMNGIYKIQKK
ncbi:MAG: hypothetical protein WDZ70_02805 [Candidatus Paceibacterota bacterium]